ncbi:S24 family peptidase [Terriglobus sp. RCC_193]|uniref:S24 family peptidase n=1 Tax=Terriglobus sp. RCC_193 TaxID=3239218 RepID=UPI003525B2C9
MNDSRRTLHLISALLLALPSLLCGGEGFAYALTSASAKGYLTDMLVREAEPPSNSGQEAVRSFIGQYDHWGDKIHGWNPLSKYGDYAHAHMDVNENMRTRAAAELRLKIGEALLHARKRLKLNQSELAQTLGTGQTNVSKWEKGKDKPPHTALLVMADLVPDSEKGQWQEWAGIKPQPPSPREPRDIAVLRDAAAAGTPRMVNEKEIDFRLSLPAHLLPVGGKLFGVPIEGDSMSPVLETGYIAIVDINRRDPKKLQNRMVAARDEDGGVTIKWLRYQDPMYLLVPQNTSQRHPVYIVREGDQVSIVGEVVMWIGKPPLSRK